MTDKDIILLLTGQMAANELNRITEKFPQTRVSVLPISVAAFTTPRLVERHAKELIARFQPKIIMVSGLARGDFGEVGEKLGVRIVKGTRYLSALPNLLKNFHALKNMLSPREAADKFIHELQLREIRRKIKQLEKEAVFGKRNFRTVSGLAIGIDFPPRVMAELVDATSRPQERSVAAAHRYSKWADIIDVGATIDKPNPERVASIVEEIQKVGLPVSIDTLNEKEIIAGVDAGAEIVLSIDFGNRSIVQRLPEDIVFVCLPTNVAEGIFPENPQERAKNCIRLCEELQKLGCEKVLADPLLEAPIRPGLIDSLTSYKVCRELDADLPLLAGVANVTEFVDADTAGMNALLACLSVELGICVLLSTEERPLTMYAIRELKASALMAFLARTLNTTPKEIGVTVLAAKSSNIDVQPVKGEGMFQNVAERERKYRPDPKGSFRIGVDYQKGKILCEHRTPTGDVTRLMANNGKGVLQEILAKNLVGTLEHAAYLGWELSKAEIALLLGHNYLQDDVWQIETVTDLSNTFSNKKMD